MTLFARPCAGWLIGLIASFGPATVAWAAPGVSAARSFQSASSPGAPVAGLIVKFRNAPGTAALAQPEARALSAEAAGASVAAQAERFRQVLSGAGVAPVGMRAVGRAAQWLDFGRPLSAADARDMADRLRQRPEVEWVVPNEREQRLQVPDDTYFAASASSSGQWWMHPAGGSSANAVPDRLRGVPGLQSAWPTSTGTAAAVVAVLDTGITAHPDLAAHLLPGHDFVSELAYANDGDGRDTDPADPGDAVTAADKANNPALFGECDVDTSSWHGTVIAGIVSAQTNNGLGVAGTNWNGRVLPVRVAGKCGATVADIVDGMRWAAGLSVAGAPVNANPARVINISFGGSADCNAAYQDAIDELRSVGAVVVAAAGNGHGSVKRPASCAGVIGVAALNRDGFKATYSNFGPAVVVATVGGDPASEGQWGPLLGDDGLLTVDNLGLSGPETPSYGHHAGTSFATPVVAGVLSLMLSANPGLSVAQLIDGVRRTARPHVAAASLGACSDQNPGRCACTASTCGAGILDAPQALQFALAPTTYVAPAGTAAVVDSAELSRAAALGLDIQPVDPPSAAASAGEGGGASGALWLVLLVSALAALRLSGGAGSGARRPGAGHEALAQRR